MSNPLPIKGKLGVIREYIVKVKTYQASINHTQGWKHCFQPRLGREINISLIRVEKSREFYEG